MATVLHHLEQDNYLTKLMEGVAPEWCSEFQRFVETGEAQEAFLNYLNQDPAAQDAVEKAFNHQVEQFEGLAAELKKRQQSDSSIVVQSATPTKLANVVEVVMQTPKDQREEVVETSTAQLVASTSIEERKVLEQIARSIDSNLSKLADVTHS